jgi:hypothetical protein
MKVTLTPALIVNVFLTNPQKEKDAQNLREIALASFILLHSVA